MHKQAWQNQGKYSCINMRSLGQIQTKNNIIYIKKNKLKIATL